jgi:ABC-type glycerol-3-phosphate transport system substrate-binding protein
LIVECLFPVAINFCKWKGQYVALPVDLYTQVLLYNQTMFNNLGLTPPTRDFADAAWTWDKFLALGQQLTHNAGQPTAQYGSPQAWSDTSTLSWVYGGDWFEPEGYITGVPKQFPYQADAVTAGMQFKVDCTYKFHIQPSADEAKALRGTLPTDFHTGRYGMSDLHFFTLKSLSTITSFDWRVAATPTPPSLPRRNTVYPGQWASFRPQPHPDEAWQLLSSRRSLAAAWKKAVQGQFAKLTDDDLDTVVAAAEHAQVSPSHAIVDFAQISSQVITPTLTKLAANQITADNALASMTPAVQKLLAQTT